MGITKRFSFSVALTLTTRIVMAVNSVVAGVLVARFLGANSLGVYLVLATTIQILMQVSGFGLHMTINYFTAGQPKQLVPVGVNSFVFGILSGCVSAAALWAMSASLLPGVPPELALVGLIAVPFQVITNLVLSLFFSQGEIMKFNLIDLLNQSFVLINVLVVLVLIGGELWLLVSANTSVGIASAFISLSIFYVYASKRFPETKFKGDLSLIGSMLSYSGRGFVLWMSTFLIYRLDMVIVNYFRGSAEAAVYGVATQVTMFLLLLPNVVSFLLQARVAATQDEGGSFTARVARHTSLILFGACLVSVPGCLLVAKIYGPGFEELPLLFWILLPGVFLIGVQSVVSQYFVGTGMPLFLSVAWVLTLGINMLLDIAMVPNYGAVGAAAVASICYAGISFAIFYFFFQKTRIGIRQILVPDLKEIRDFGNLFREKTIRRQVDINAI